MEQPLSRRWLPQIFEWLVIAGVAAALSACGDTGPSQLTGLTGVVVRGPVTPVCRVDVSCDAPFSAGFSAERDGRMVARFRSDTDGRFTVWLDPGAYTIIPDADAPVIAPRSQSKRVTVGESGLTEVRLVFDTGIR